MVLAHLIFAVQQVHLCLRYSPLQSSEGMTKFRTESTMQLFWFVCLVVGPLVPSKYFVIPTCLFYSSSYWGVYLNATKCDITMSEAIYRYVCYTLTIVIVAYITE